jgi:hypothetical protein
MATVIRKGRVDASVGRSGFQHRQLGEIQMLRIARQKKGDHALFLHEIAQEIRDGIGLPLQFQVGDRTAIGTLRTRGRLNGVVLRPAADGAIEEIVKQRRLARNRLLPCFG